MEANVFATFNKESLVAVPVLQQAAPRAVLGGQAGRAPVGLRAVAKAGVATLGPGEKPGKLNLELSFLLPFLRLVAGCRSKASGFAADEILLNLRRRQYDLLGYVILTKAEVVRHLV